MPWPLLYETLRTRMARNAAALLRFSIFMRQSNIYWLDDAHYRESAYAMAIGSSLDQRRPLSMVDCLLRLIIADTNSRIDYLLTYNPGDFADICRKHRVQLI